MLDAAETREKKILKDAMKGKFATISQDGWSDIYNSPVIATSIHVEGKTNPFIFEAAGTEKKTAAFLTEKAKEAIPLAEEDFEVIVTAFTCENSNDHLEEMFSVATKTNELFQTNYFSLTAIPD